MGFLLKTRMNVESSDLAPCGGQDSKDSGVSEEAGSIPVVSWSQRLHKAPVPSGPFTGFQMEQLLSSAVSGTFGLHEAGATSASFTPEHSMEPGVQERLVKGLIPDDSSSRPVLGVAGR